jgi:hypothetical protein
MKKKVSKYDKYNGAIPKAPMKEVASHLKEHPDSVIDSFSVEGLAL